jgi:hypothetical protein
MENAGQKDDGKLTLNGKPVTPEKLEEQKKLAEKTGAKITEKSPGEFNLRLND